MRTAVVSFYEAYPPDSGAASVTYHCAKHATGERAIIQVGECEQRAVTHDGVRVYTLPGARSRVERLLRMRWTIGRMVEVCGEVDPDVVFLEGASWTVYLLGLMRALRRAASRAVIVYHAHNVEYVLRREKQGPLVAAITRWAEKHLFREADVAFAVSGVDRQQIEALYGVRTHVLPNGVDAERFGRVPQEQIDSVRARYGLGDPSVLFMGFYTYQPNREAIDRLVESVFPLVLAKRRDAKLVVIGSRIPHARRWLICPGSIAYDELPAFMAACTVGVAPIRSGSGTRLKILEYLAAGLPVVSTAKGAEGLDLRHQCHLEIAEDDKDFADAAVRLLEEPDRAKTLAERGRAFVRQNYAWTAILPRCFATIERRLLKRSEQSLG